MPGSGQCCECLRVVTAEPSQLAAGTGQPCFGLNINIHQEEKRGNLVVVGQIYSPGPQAILGCLYRNVVWEISIRCEGQMQEDMCKKDLFLGS